MRKFDYSFLQNGKVSAELLNLATSVAELRVRSDNLKSTYEDAFEELHKKAIISSVKNSNAIEGIMTSDERIRAIVVDGSEPLTHSEAEIAGYKDALELIFADYKSLNITEDLIKGLHRALLSRVAVEGGEYKQYDNDIIEVAESGGRKIRFSPTSASETLESMEQLVLAFREARANPHINQLLLSACFVLDFLSIHPFLDGNGRISRLLSVLLLCQDGYDVVKYISLEEQIGKFKDYYYDSLRESSAGWHEGENDYTPFMENFLAMVYACYKEMGLRFSGVSDLGVKASKSKRIEAIVMDSLTPVSKADLQELLPDVSVTTIEAALNELVKAGKIEKIGNGRNTRYLRA